jgi:NAD(P)-dependent dehydrogenase (short-subunit alcohol dehydrogenase family)
LTKSKIASVVLKNQTIEESIAKMHPLKRIGKGDDSANLANFLLTTKSSWITGQIIGVDGGRSNIS